MKILSPIFIDAKDYKRNTKKIEVECIDSHMLIPMADVIT